MMFTDIEGIILAAGFSSRTNVFKMMLNIAGKTLLERCIDSMYDFCNKVIIIGGHKFECIKPIAEKYSKVKLIYNRNYSEGMLTSVKLAFKNLSSERFFFTPGDYPLINKSTYETLMNNDGDILIPTYNGEKGHPIMIKKYIAEQFLNDNRNLILREFINTSNYKTIKTQDEGILIDVDTWEDYNMVLDKILEAEVHG